MESVTPLCAEYQHDLEQTLGPVYAARLRNQLPRDVPPTGATHLFQLLDTVGTATAAIRTERLPADTPQTSLGQKSLNFVLQGSPVYRARSPQDSTGTLATCMEAEPTFLQSLANPEPTVRKDGSPRSLTLYTKDDRVVAIRKHRGESTILPFEDIPVTLDVSGQIAPISPKAITVPEGALFHVHEAEVPAQTTLLDGVKHVDVASPVVVTRLGIGRLTTFSLTPAEVTAAGYDLDWTFSATRPGIKEREVQLRPYALEVPRVSLQDLQLLAQNLAVEAGIFNIQSIT